MPADGISLRSKRISACPAGSSPIMLHYLFVSVEGQLDVAFTTFSEILTTFRGFPVIADAATILG
jgi:hypothetical protein